MNEKEEKEYIAAIEDSSPERNARRLKAVQKFLDEQDVKKAREIIREKQQRVRRFKMDATGNIITKLKAAIEEIKRTMAENERILKRAQKSQTDLDKMLGSLQKLLKDIGH